MATVHMVNGDDGATTDGMFVHAFSGKPVDQLEFIGDPEEYIGDTFAINVRVDLVGVNVEKVNDGTRHVLKLRVVSSQPLQLVQRKSEKDVDPDQITMDESLGDYDPDA